MTDAADTCGRDALRAELVEGELMICLCCGVTGFAAPLDGLSIDDGFGYEGSSWVKHETFLERLRRLPVAGPKEIRRIISASAALFLENEEAAAGARSVAGLERSRENSGARRSAAVCARVEHQGKVAHALRPRLRVRLRLLPGLRRAAPVRAPGRDAPEMRRQRATLVSGKASAERR